MFPPLIGLSMGQGAGKRKCVSVSRISFGCLVSASKSVALLKHALSTPAVHVGEVTLRSPSLMFVRQKMLEHLWPIRARVGLEHPTTILAWAISQEWLHLAKMTVNESSDSGVSSYSLMFGRHLYTIGLKNSMIYEEWLRRTSPSALSCVRLHWKPWIPFISLVGDRVTYEFWLLTAGPKRETSSWGLLPYLLLSPSVVPLRHVDVSFGCWSFQIYTRTCLPHVIVPSGIFDKKWSRKTILQGDIPSEVTVMPKFDMVVVRSLLPCSQRCFYLVRMRMGKMLRSAYDITPEHRSTLA
ncbi:hypothetical protein Tco_0303036 [Tanacetum coccineum]